ncbi:uncharacterized protein LOC128878576 [Hylaeus volcanicus]|uniref:uncharacterized protein LOC128878576 n=1 Tax=Hylaeus volcanicus TaxID=313075 RepID=UPI0023B7C52B|nr:uncharacterized protein LOC128878576 [Hylaeus volcanicus]
MFQRIIGERVLLCLIVDVILVSGSFWNYPQNQQPRTPRHASCPSCSRDCPDALVSWYMPPSRREYRNTESFQPFQPSSSFDPAPYGSYNRASGSRGTPEYPRRRENPFSFQREFDSDVASAPSAPVQNSGEPVNPYQPRLPFFKHLDRSPYRKPNFYDVIRPQSMGINNRYSDYYSPDDEPYMEDVPRSSYPSWDRPLRPLGDPQKKIHVVYRADRYTDDSMEEENPTTGPEQFPRWQIPHRISGNSAAGPREEGFDGFPQPRRDQPRESSLVYQPEIKYSPYNIRPDLNLLKMMQSVAKNGVVIGSGGAWQDLGGQGSENRTLMAIEGEDNKDEVVKEMEDQRKSGLDSQEDQRPEFKGKRDAEGGSIRGKNADESEEPKNTAWAESSIELGSLESTEPSTQPRYIEVDAMTVGPLMLP